MEEKLEVEKKKRDSWDSSIIIALIAVLISCASAIIGLAEAKTLQKQQKIMMEQKSASAWPYISVQPDFSYVYKDDKVYCEYSITNKGIGPALLGDVQCYLADKEIETYEVVDELKKTYPDFEFNYRSNYQIDRLVISPKEEIKLVSFEITGIQERGNEISSLVNNLPFSIEICYCSVYEECWKLANRNVERIDGTCEGAANM